MVPEKQTLHRHQHYHYY